MNGRRGIEVYYAILAEPTSLLGGSGSVRFWTDEREPRVTAEDKLGSWLKTYVADQRVIVAVTGIRDLS